MAATKILKVQILVPSITLATELFITLRQREGPHVMYITSSRLYSPGEILQNESWIVRLSKSLRDFPPPHCLLKSKEDAPIAVATVQSAFTNFANGRADNVRHS